MPDPKKISGVPLPLAEVPVGTVTVRVIRGSFANNLPGQRVELLVDGTPRTALTNAQGRAEFNALAPGARVKASVTVDGERLESQEFAVPGSGGIRVVLAATDPEIEKRAEEDRRLAQGPAQKGIVVAGEQSRFVIEMGDDALSVFNIIQLVNTARVPVDTGGPIVFEVPEGGGPATVLEGSSPQATASGSRVTIAGPFAPGPTTLQFAYSMPYSDPDVTIQQRMPVTLNQFSVMAQKMGEMHLSSPQITGHRDITTPEGQVYVVGQGPAVKAGDTVTLNFTALPYAPKWPRNLALAIATLILVGGAYSTIRGRPATEHARRQKLEARRDRLFNDLTALELQHRARTIDTQRYGVKRRDLVSSLERVYAELDEDSAAGSRAS